MTIIHSKNYSFRKNGNYSFKKLFNWKKIIQKNIHSKNWKIIHSKNYSFFWKIDYRPGLVATDGDTDRDNYSRSASNVQGDSGGVLMMQEKSGRRRWIQVFFEKHKSQILNQTHWEPWPLTHLELSFERWGFMPM